MTLDEIREAGAEWMRASLAVQPATPEQQRRVRILMAPQYPPGLKAS